MVISGSMTWRQGLLEDIDIFSKNETYGSKFDHVKNRICDNEKWHSVK